MRPRKPTKRVVHYRAHGSNALTFACYNAELKASVESPNVHTAFTKRRNLSLQHYGRSSIPLPLGHTDLTVVTCPQCWEAIYTMALKRTGRKAFSL